MHFNSINIIIHIQVAETLLPSSDFVVANSLTIFVAFDALDAPRSFIAEKKKTIEGLSYSTENGQISLDIFSRTTL